MAQQASNMGNSGLVSVSNGQIFRELMNSNPFIYAPGVGDPHDAGIVSNVGFKAVYLSGYSISNKAGFPDTGMVTQTEMLSVVRGTVALLERGLDGVPNIPVIADADTGYGGIGNVERTVREYILTRVAGLHMEDQKGPKKCGHIAGKEVIPIEDAVAKYRNAVYTRDKLDPNLYLIARTDAAGAVGGSIDDAITRGRAYIDVGMDALWPELGNTERGPLEYFAREMKKTHPDVVLAVNYSSNLHWGDSKITHEELGEMGYRFIFTTLASLEAGRLAVYNHLVDLLGNGAKAQWDLEKEKKEHPLGSSQQSLGMLPHQQGLDDMFDEKAAQRRDASEGFGSKTDEHARTTHGGPKGN